MTNIVLLDTIAHADLRVATGYAAGFGDAVNQCVVFPTEFDAVQREYPILFRRDAAGAFYAVALLGLDRDENLFLDQGGWSARHIPVLHQRGPFLIGTVERDIDGVLQSEPMLHVDLERVSPLAVPVLTLIGREKIATGLADDALLIEAEALAAEAMRPD